MRSKWIIIGLLVACEVAVMGMILFPQVEPHYRAVFIDGTSDCWPHPVSGAIEPDQRISFLAADDDAAAKALLRCGWLKAQDSGTWSVGPEARLLLQLQPGRAAAVDIDLWAFGTSQRVAITGNGEPLAHWTVSAEPRTQTLTLPPLADGRLELALHFPDAVSPRELGLAEDRRKLAIGLQGLTLRMQ